MTDTIINATLQFIWYPLVWIFGATAPPATMYVCPEQPCTINQIFISPDECIILQTINGENSRIKGACTKADGKLTIKEDDKTYVWNFKEDGDLFELYDEQTKKTIKLVRANNK